MNYEELIKSSASRGGNNYSKSELNTLATVMMNDPTADITVHFKKGDTFETRVYNPGKSIRANLIAPILRNFGVDRAEMGKLDDMQISRAGGEALADFSLLLVKSYISKKGLGRKLTLPMLSTDETVQTLECDTTKEEKRATTRIVRQEDGTYVTTPTGKLVTTRSHEKLKTTNRVPAWLKTTQDA